MLDTDRREISYHRIPYNHAIAERRAQQARYRMGWTDERVYEAARALRRGKRIMQVGVERALGALRM